MGGMVSLRTASRGRRVGLVAPALRAMRLVVVLAVVAALSGCWEQIGYGPGHTWSNPLEKGLTTANVASLEPVWSVPAQASFIEPSLSEPITDGDRVYVVRHVFTGDEQVIGIEAIDAASGATAWERTLDTMVGGGGGNVAMAPALVGGELWTGYLADEGEFPPSGVPGCRASRMRLDARSGAVIAEETGFGSSAVPTGSIIAQKQGAAFLTPTCQDTAPSVAVRDRQTLATTWTAPLPAINGAPNEIGPTVSQGRIFVFHGDLFTIGHVLYAFAADGCGAATCSPIWTANVPSGTVPVGPPVATPDGRVLALYRDAFGPPASTELVAYSATTGTVAWRTQIGDDTILGARVRMAVNGNRVYIMSRPNTPGASGRILQVFATSGCGAATCTPLWTASTGDVDSTTLTAGPVVAGGVVYVAGFTGIHAFAAAGCGAATCTEIATIPVDGEIATSMSVNNGRLYVTTNTNRLIAYAPT